jgi:SAM-dependent methyltransferase
MVTKILGAITAASPKLKRVMWKRWYQFLARGYQNEDWTFMNYGYADTDADAPTLRLDEADEADRYSIQLYHAVVGGVDLRGKNVLEVGSGRGGGSSYIARYLHPAAMLGIDYSENAVALSRKRHSAPGLSYQQGDAEALPCADGTFDAVINVESSHCYGSMDRFLGEVYRVLKPGGYFLWADMCARGGRDASLERFRRAGLEPRHEVEITPNVLAGLDRASERKREMINRHVPRYLLGPFQDFAGVPGTRVYESLRAGDVEYRRGVFQKPLAGA